MVPASVRGVPEGSDKVDLNNYAAKKTAAAGQAFFT